MTRELPADVVEAIEELEPDVESWESREVPLPPEGAFGPRLPPVRYDLGKSDIPRGDDE